MLADTSVSQVGSFVSEVGAKAADLVVAIASNKIGAFLLGVWLFVILVQTVFARARRW